MTEGRTYQQRTRAVSAENTRRRILDAVRRLLGAGSASAVNIDAVARAAGVTRPTIYSSFGSRAGLCAAAGADLLQSAGFAAVVQSAHHPDALAGMHEGFRRIVDVYANDRDVFRALYTAGHADADTFGGAIAELERERAECMTELAGRLDAQGYLREGLTFRSAEDVLWLLTSFDSFDLLRTGRGLDRGTVSATLSSTAHLALLGSSPA